MKCHFPERFTRQLEALPVAVQEKFYKQLRFLLSDLRYPSLRTKKYDEARGIWQAWVDRYVRFYFTVDGDAYVFLKIIKHPK